MDRKRLPDHVERPQFRRLYERIQNGSVTLEELLTAATLRRLPEARRRKSPELNKLYHQLWEADA